MSKTDKLAAALAEIEEANAKDKRDRRSVKELGGVVQPE